MTARARLLVALAALVLLPLGAFLWWIEGELAPRVTELSAEELERVARLTAALIGERSFSDPLADSLGASTGRRVTLIAPDGEVLGDSEVPADRLPDVENHAERPEVRAALEGRVGTALRTSPTVNRTLLYVAVPHGEGVVRLSRPAEPLNALPARARRLVLAALIATLGLAMAVGPLVVRFVLGPLREVRGAVEALASDDPAARAPVRGRGESAKLARAVNAFADRTREAVSSLRAERDDLDALFESLDDGLAVIDAEGTVVRANPAFDRWAGRTATAGRRVATLFRSPDLAAAVERGLAGRSDSREVVLGEKTVLLVVQPHGDGALLMLHDLTHLRRLEGVRRDFVANVSHELKTPLTSVIGFAEAAVEGDPTLEQSREFARRILVNARRMRQLVDDLLDLARIESGPWEPRPEAADVAPVARAVWASLQPGPDERDVRLEIEDEETPGVHADPDALRQMLRNLFDNALRYAPEGSSVRLGQRLEDGEVRVSVSDEGPGIPSAHLSRIFERFYRVDPARSRAAGGTGLGLAIVKHLATAHGGHVGVESELGRGTTVWFTLPVAEPALAAGGFRRSRDR